MSYIFTQPVQQSGGGFSDGTLMVPDNAPKSKPQIRQYFQRHGLSDVEFFDPAAFCEYLETKFFNDGRSVFFREQTNSRNLEVYSNSPYAGYKKEVFIIGTLEAV